MSLRVKHKKLFSILSISIGFTLFEVLIAMTILATLSILTAQSISRSIRDKARIQNNIDNTSSLETAFKIIERDIQMTFNFRDIQYEVDMRTRQGRQNTKAPTKNPNVPPLRPSSFNIKRPIQTTQFIGSEEKIDFVTLLQGRGYDISLEGDLKEVGYYLEQCRTFGNSKESSNCLWRRISSFVDDDVERGGNARVLLENVKSLEFKFYDTKLQSWKQTWNSKTQKFFPEAIEVTLETNRNKRPLKLQSVIPIRHPNNLNNSLTNNLNKSPTARPR